MLSNTCRMSSVMVILGILLGKKHTLCLFWNRTSACWAEQKHEKAVERVQPYSDIHIIRTAKCGAHVRCMSHKSQMLLNYTCSCTNLGLDMS